MQRRGIGALHDEPGHAVFQREGAADAEDHRAVARKCAPDRHAPQRCLDNQGLVHAGALAESGPCDQDRAKRDRELSCPGAGPRLASAQAEVGRLSMALKIALLAAAAALTAGTASAAVIDIRDAVVRVTVIPEARNDVAVEIVRPNGQLPLSVSTLGDRTIIDGGLHHDIRDCSRDGPNARVKVRGVGTVSWDEMPQIVIRAPRAVAIQSNGAAYGAIGRSGSLELRNSGCA